MAYRKLWWKYGANSVASVQQKLAPYNFSDTSVKHGDTFFDTNTDKTMHLVYATNFPDTLLPINNRVWINSDMTYGFSDEGNSPGVSSGSVVAVNRGLGYSPDLQALSVRKTLGTTDSEFFCGVVHTEGDFNGSSPIWKLWGIAQQGIYGVKFNDVAVPTYFIAGNLAIISDTTQGRATQGGKTGSIGVIGVIASTIYWNPDWGGPTPTIPVIIQSYSSK